MRLFAAILLIIAASIGFAQAEPSCGEMGPRWQQLVKEYDFAGMERLADRAVKECSIDDSFELFQQAAQTYLWRGELGKAKPIIDQIKLKSKQGAESSPTSVNLGISNTLPLIDAIYRGEHDAIEEILMGYENLIPRSQEVALIYLLRRNDPRFPAFYKIRKQMRLDKTSILCGIYCKRNTSVKDCPCAAEKMPTSQGGPYSVYLEYLDGKPAEELKKDIDARYGQAPLLKKEILQCLGM